MAETARRSAPSEWDKLASTEECPTGATHAALMLRLEVIDAARLAAYFDARSRKGGHQLAKVKANRAAINVAKALGFSEPETFRLDF